MYQIQQDKLAYFEKQIGSHTREITYRLTLNDQPLHIDKVMDNLVLTTDSGLNQYGVGCALVTQLQMSVKKEVLIIPKDKIMIEVGLGVYNAVTQKNEIIYSPLGTFYVDTVEEKGIKKSLKAYDGMYKLNKGYFPSSKHTTTQAIANDIAQANGYKVKGVVDVTINNEQLEGKNANEMLSLVASAMGRNVRISRDGSTIEFVEPINTGLKFGENKLSTATLDDSTTYNITKLRINYSDKVSNDKGEVVDEGYYTVGEGTDATTLVLSNPLLKGHQAQATNVLNIIKKVNGYKRFDTTMPLADYRLEPMDMVTYSKGGVDYLVPILYTKMVLSYQGISLETQSPTQPITKSEFNFKGTLSQKIENVYSDILVIKQLTANKVTTDELEATIATIEKLYATKAEISDLIAGSIIVDDLKAQIANINNLVVNKADIADLTALIGRIDNLSAKVGEIDKLISDSILSEIIQAGSISSDLLNIKDAFIKDAMIDSVTANKVTSGTINTNNVNISSENGGMLLQGNLLQFKDKNGVVRIQIGQDTQGNYTFTLYDSTGKGVLINEQGIQSSDAIKDGLIVDAKVADNANISGHKLNITTVYEAMNADGSSTLKANKVVLDDKNQTLDVSFKEMTTKQDNMENTMNTAITDINVAQGQITQLIQNTTITNTDGSTTTLKDAYNHTKSTVDSHTTQIGNMESTINAQTGEIQSVKNETAEMKVDLGKIELGLSTLDTTVKNDYYTKKDTDSAIKIAKEQIELGVSTTYETKTEVANKINGIQLGTRNFALKSNKEFANNDYLTSWYTPSELFKVGEEYTVTLCVTPAQGVSYYGFYVSSGWKGLAQLTVSGTSKQTVSATFRFDGYHVDKTPTKPTDGDAHYNVYRFPNDNTVTSNSTIHWIKVEKGNKPSDWSLAPEDVDTAIEAVTTETKKYTDSAIKIAKDSITQTVSETYETKTEVEKKINGIVVGATNLVVQSSTLNNQFHHFGGYMGTRTVVDDTTARCGKHIEFECTTRGAGFFMDLWTGDASCVGKEYTWSFYAKTNRPRKFDSIGHERGGATSIDVTTEWQKFTHTWVFSERGFSKFTFYPFFEVGDILYIKDFKIERGNRATDWSPAPEDMVSADNFYTKTQTDSRIEQRADSITSEVVKIERTLAIDNLLANGNFTNGLNNWEYVDSGVPVNYTISANTDWVMKGKNALLLTATNHPQGHDSGFTQVVEVKPHTDYTFTGYVASHRAEGLVIIKDNQGAWLNMDKTNPDVDNYPGTNDVTKWKRVRIVFNSGIRNKLYLHLALGTSRDNGHVWFHDFMVHEGIMDLCWKPSERENRAKLAILDNRITSTVSSISTVNGKVDRAQSQIDQQATQIASKVNTNDFSSLIQQNGHSVMASINNSRGSMGVGVDMNGLSGYNNNLMTFRLTEGKMHVYNSHNGQHMGYFGTFSNDLRANLTGTNTFSVMHNDSTILLRGQYNRDSSYGNCTIDLCGGINFIHKPGQSTGLNQILLGNDDRSDAYGYHNISMRVWNSMGFADNANLTHMFLDARRGRWIMKGAVYQNAQTPPRMFSMNFDEDDEVYRSGFTRKQAVDSIMHLKTGVYVDNDGECCTALYGGHDELITTEYTDEEGITSTHINTGALNASLVVTCQEQQKQIEELREQNETLQQELAQIKLMLTSLMTK